MGHLIGRVVRGASDVIKFFDKRHAIRKANPPLVVYGSRGDTNGGFPTMLAWGGHVPPVSQYLRSPEN
jgi:hypothetical protein